MLGAKHHSSVSEKFPHFTERIEHILDTCTIHHHSIRDKPMCAFTTKSHYFLETICRVF